MKKSGRLLAFLVLLLAVSGCAHVISPEMRQRAAKEPPFSSVLSNPENYVGQTVILGGIIIDAVNEPDNTTTLKVLETPLDYSGFPQDEESTQGRFMAKVSRYLDKEVYKKGRRITLAGEVAGKEVQPLGDTQYTYPVISVKELHLWKRIPSYGPYVYDYWYWGGYPYPYHLPYHYYYFSYPY